MNNLPEFKSVCHLTALASQALAVLLINYKHPNHFSALPKIQVRTWTFNRKGMSRVNYSFFNILKSLSHQSIKKSLMQSSLPWMSVEKPLQNYHSTINPFPFVEVWYKDKHEEFLVVCCCRIQSLCEPMQQISSYLFKCYLLSAHCSEKR